MLRVQNHGERSEHGRSSVRSAHLRMKFVALVSGGKDSCYNIMKCLSFGHELVCLANLCPPPDFTGEDMNSFMYQTAACNVLDAFPECLGVPLIREPIRGKAAVQSLNYSCAEEDEVEDLFRLLLAVKVVRLFTRLRYY